MFGAILQSLILSFSAYGAPHWGYSCTSVRPPNARRSPPTHKLYLVKEARSKEGKSYKLTLNNTYSSRAGNLADVVVQEVKSDIPGTTAFGNDEKKFLLFIYNEPSSDTRTHFAKLMSADRIHILEFDCSVSIRAQ